LIALPGGLHPLASVVLMSHVVSAPPAGPTQAPGVREGYGDAGGGVRLFFRVAGTHADTVIVLHGGPGLTMEYLAQDLAPLTAHHTLLFHDQRGAGRSTLVSDSAGLDGQRFAEDLEAVRRHFGFRRVTLLAHSWGAAVAALYAARSPDRIGRLLIVDGVPPRQRDLMEARRGLAARRDSATRDRMQHWLEVMRADPGDTAACHAYYALCFGPFFADPANLARSRGDFCAGTAESRRNKMANIDRYVFASLGAWEWRPALGRVRAPALVIHGSADWLPPEGGREWAAALPRLRCVASRVRLAASKSSGRLASPTGDSSLHRFSVR
jgi:proline iminopeptidase